MMVVTLFSTKQSIYVKSNVSRDFKLTDYRQIDPKLDIKYLHPHAFVRSFKLDVVGYFWIIELDTNSVQNIC